MNELIATMDKQQLTSSLQQIVQKWKELQGNAAAGAQPCRPSASDSQLLRPATGTHTEAMTTPPKKVRRRLPELPRESGGAYHSALTGARPSLSERYLRRPGHTQRNGLTIRQRSPPATKTNKESRQPKWRATPDKGPLWSPSSLNSRVMLNISNVRNKTEYSNSKIASREQQPKHCGREAKTQRPPNSYNSSTVGTEVNSKPSVFGLSSAREGVVTMNPSRLCVKTSDVSCI